MSLDFFLNVTSEGTASSAVEDSSLSTSTTTAITNDTGHHEVFISPTSFVAKSSKKLDRFTNNKHCSR